MCWLFLLTMRKFPLQFLIRQKRVVKIADVTRHTVQHLLLAFLFLDINIQAVALLYYLQIMSE